MSFTDMPPENRLSNLLRKWRHPAVPASLEKAVQCLWDGGKPENAPKQLEREILDWLYTFIRLNIKRGPVFDFAEALRTRRADCLAYCKLFTALGRRMGLDAGIVDVLIDSGGRYAPHTANLVKTSGHKPRFIDLWYGSRDIRHRRLGLQVKEGNRRVVRDVNFPELKGLEVSYLPDKCVDGITLYVLGNRHLSRSELKQAVQCYARSIALYPESIRPFYNRAIAFERLGELRRANSDYEAAFRDESSLIRTIAREHPEITALSQLDEKAIDERGQEIYLLRRGVITGKAVPIALIAARYGIPEDRARAMLSGVERRLTGPAT